MMKLKVLLMIICSVFFLSCSTSIEKITLNNHFKVNQNKKAPTPYGAQQMVYVLRGKKYGWDFFYLRKSSMVDAVIEKMNQYARDNNLFIDASSCSVEYHNILFLWGYATVSFASLAKQ